MKLNSKPTSLGPAIRPILQPPSVSLATPKRVLFHGTIGLLVLIAVMITGPLLGTGLNWKLVFADAPWAAEFSSPDSLIFWGTRVPRVLAAVLAGGCLALAGLVYQAVLRNPLAEPFLLGISAGAGAGKAFLILAAPAFLAVSPIAAVAFCFAGALVPLAIIQTLSVTMRRFNPVTLLLAGTMLNVILGAVVMLFQVFAPADAGRQIQLWWLGGLDVAGYKWLAPATAAAGIAGFVVLVRTRSLNVLSTGHLAASHLGLQVDSELRTMLWLATLLASSVVAIVGPIGFVGLIVPHVLRLIFGMDHRLLAPLSVIYGGLFLLVCDLAGWRGMEIWNRIVPDSVNPVQSPVGILTSLIGGPLFLILLYRQQIRDEAI
jgi:iron complex transport system permease protein